MWNLRKVFNPEVIMYRVTLANSSTVSLMMEIFLIETIKKELVFYDHRNPINRVTMKLK